MYLHLDDDINFVINGVSFMILSLFSVDIYAKFYTLVEFVKFQLNAKKFLGPDCQIAYHIS